MSAPLLIGHIVGNADILAIRFRSRLFGRGKKLQLWIDEDGCLVCSSTEMPQAKRVARHDGLRIVGTYTDAALASDISADIEHARNQYGQRIIGERKT
jgi:hypothetical protein